MSTSGEEMILNLAAAMNGLEKTAAKKCPECGKKECECKKEEDKEDKEEKAEKEEKEEKAEKKKKSKKKKAAVMEVLNGLSKLASELDALGADEASAAVDDALRTIVSNLKKG